MPPENTTSPVLTELRVVYAVRMPSGKLRRYLRPTYAYRLAAKLLLGDAASREEVLALAQQLRRRDTNPRKMQTREVKDDAQVQSPEAPGQPG
jgi:hypothetical protein